LAVAITLTFSKPLAAIPNAGQVMRDVEQERQTLPPPSDSATEIKNTKKINNNVEE